MEKKHWHLLKYFCRYIYLTLTPPAHCIDNHSEYSRRHATCEVTRNCLSINSRLRWNELVVGTSTGRNKFCIHFWTSNVANTGLSGGYTLDQPSSTFSTQRNLWNNLLASGNPWCPSTKNPTKGINQRSFTLLGRYPLQ